MNGENIMTPAVTQLFTGHASSDPTTWSVPLSEKHAQFSNHVLILGMDASTVGPAAGVLTIVGRPIAGAGYFSCLGPGFRSVSLVTGGIYEFGMHLQFAGVIAELEFRLTTNISSSHTLSIALASSDRFLFPNQATPAV